MKKSRKIFSVSALVVLLLQSGLAWSAPISRTGKAWPSNLNTPLGKPTAKSEFITFIACVHAYTGRYVDCAFDMRINGLAQPDTSISNNGGHPHGRRHPLGDLQVIFPKVGVKNQFVTGQTKNNYVFVTHLMPEVSGKIETVLNLHVPPGSYTVWPESCNGNGLSWCFNTTLDVGIAATLLPLPNPVANPNVIYPYTRVRNALGHPDDVAYFGTTNTLFFLNNISSSYKKKGGTLSVNDMSLPRGGLFDFHANYLAPHGFHRTGQSADINKNNGDCLKNKRLRQVVDQEMPIKTGSQFAKLYFSSHFRCELNNKNNIHIDFDGIVF